MIYGLESENKKRVSMKSYEKLPKVRDIIVIDSRRLDSAEVL